jgi:carbamoyl-phosphate synthase large subunit
MNILVTAAGRRSYLVKYFQDALGETGQVVTANTDLHSPAMQVADTAIKVSRSSDPGYKQEILSICRRYSIGLLISLHDLDTLAISRFRRDLADAGVIALVPNAEWALMCLDKHQTHMVLEQHGFRSPWSCLSLLEAKEAVMNGGANLPLVVKARYGFGSLGLRVCYSLQELECAVNHTRDQLRGASLEDCISASETENVLIEQYIPGDEVCLDILNDFNGNYSAHFATVVHSMREGESQSATTLPVQHFESLARRLSSLTKHNGLWGVDLRVSSGDAYIIEINPRFTGDYPFNHIAGANVPAILIAWASGCVPAQSWFECISGIRGFKELVPTVSKSQAEWQIGADAIPGAEKPV